MQKIFLALAFVFLAFACVSAISINSQPGTVLLGEKISFNGKCEGKEVSMLVSVEGKKVSEQKAACQNSYYETSLVAPPGFPSGKWIFSFSDSRDSNSLSIFVSPKPEGELLAVNLLSPYSGSARRKEPVELSVKVFFNNSPYDSAKVYFWLPDNSRQEMAGIGNGVFNAKLEMPADFSESKFGLAIVAISPDSKMRGQLKKEISIESAEIIINVIEPAFNTIESESEQKFLIEATYADGTPIESGSAIFSIGEEALEMQLVSGNSFSAKKTFSESETGSKKAFFIVKDNFENFSSKEFAFFVEKGFLGGISKQLIFFGPIALAIIIVLALVFLLAKKISSPKKAAKKIASLKKQLKDLQNQYFVERSVPEDYYRKRLNEIEMQISDAEKQLNKAKSKSK